MSGHDLWKPYSPVEHPHHTPLITAITQDSVELCQQYLNDHPDMPIPIQIVMDALKANRADIITLLIPYRVSMEQIQSHTFEMLQATYQVSNYTLWKYLVQNGCKISERIGKRSAIHLIKTQTDESIIQSIISTSPPLTPSTNDADMEYITSAIAHQKNYPILFMSLPPEMLVIETPSTFHELLHLAIFNHNSYAINWLIANKQIAVGGVDILTRCLASMVSAPISGGDLAIMVHLLQHGARVEDTKEFYVFICNALNVYADWYTDRSLHSKRELLSQVIKLMFSQRVIPVNGRDGWEAQQNSVSLIETVLRLPEHSSSAFIDIILDQGIVIPPRLCDHFDTTPQPTKLLEQAIRDGYRINTRTVLSYAQKNYIKPRTLPGCNCTVFHHDRNVAGGGHNDDDDDDGVITILKRDAYAQDDAFWSALRHDITTCTAHKIAFCELIMRAVEKNRNDILDLFTSHGFVLPDDCGGVHAKWWVLHRHIHPRMLTRVLSWGIPLNQLDNDKTPLDCAIDRMRMAFTKGVDPCDAKVALQLFSMGAIFSHTVQVYTPNSLHVVVSLDNYSMLQCLLDRGITANPVFPYNRPFHYVKSYNIAKLLIDYGFDVNDDNPLLSIKDTSISQLLIDHGANVNPNNKRGPMLLGKAMLNGNWSLVKLLIENHANMAQRPGDGSLLLTCINRFNGDVSKIAYLLDQGYTIRNPTQLFSILASQQTLNIGIAGLIISHCQIDLTTGDYFSHLLSNKQFHIIEGLMDIDSIQHCLKTHRPNNAKGFNRPSKTNRVMDQATIDFYMKYGIQGVD